jgi:hypothetical protein
MADKDRLPRILASAPFAMQTAHSQNRASLRRKLGGAKLKPNLPLDALRKDFAQRAKSQPKAARDQRFPSVSFGGGGPRSNSATV